MRYASWMLNGSRWVKTAMVLILGAVVLTTAGCAGKTKAEKLHEEGALLYKHRKYYKAIEKFEEALKEEPNRPRTQTMLADAYLKTNKPETAVQLAEKVVAQDPQQDEASLVLGQALLAEANLDTTRTQSGAERGADPAKLKRAAEIASALRKKNPNAIEGMLLQAEVDLQNKQPNLAEQLYTAVLKQNPKESRAQLGLARVLLNQRKFAEAEAALAGPAKEENPNPQVIWHLAMAQMLEKKYDAAWGTIEPSLDGKNKDPDLTHHLLAGQILLAQLQSLRDTTSTTETATTPADAASTESLKNMAEQAALDSAPRQAATEAEMKRIVGHLADLGSRMKGVWPARPESWYFRGLSYQFQGQLPEAITHFQEAIRRAPGARDFRMALAGAHIQQREFDLAREDLRNLLKELPGDTDAQLKLASTYLMENKPSEAVGLLRQLNLEDPENKQIKQMLGQTLALSGDPTQAQEGLKLLEETMGAASLMPGGREFVLGQAAMREASQKKAVGDIAGSTLAYQRAEQLFTKAFKDQPTNYLISARLTELAELRGDVVTALSHAIETTRLKPEYALQEARLYARLGQVPAALERYTRLVDKSPDNLRVQLEYADLLRRAGRTSDALARVDAILAKQPDSGLAISNKGQMLISARNPTGARKYLEEAITQHPALLDPVVTLAHLELQLGEWAAATEHLKAAVQIATAQLSAARGVDNRKQEALDLRNRLAPLQLELGIAQLIHGESAPAISSAHDARATLDAAKTEADMLEAVAQLRQGKTREAATLIDGLEDKDGRLRGFIPLLRSAIDLADGDKAKAREAVKNQPDLNQNSLQLYDRMLERAPAEALKAGIPDLALLIYLGQRTLFAEACVELSDKLLNAIPNDPFLLARKAEAQQMQGRGRDALATYETLSKALPEYLPGILVQMDLNLALAEASRMRGDKAAFQKHYDHISELARQGTNLAPNSAELLTKLASLEQMAGNVEKANDLYRRIIRIDPKNVPAHNNLAWNLSEAGQFDEAVKEAQEAVNAAPRSGGVLDTLGWIEFKRGNFKRAAELLDHASKLQPDMPEIRYHLAQALEKTGDAPGAVASLERIVLAWPNYDKQAEVRAMLERLAPGSGVLTPRDAATTATAAQGKP